MSTRGTYYIEKNLCYNHHDNYPVGAAFHIVDVIKATGGTSFFDFIRGMKTLSPATSIYDGPAEFHYKIENGHIECFSIPWDEDKLVLVSKGPIEDWVNNEIKNNWDRLAEPSDNINDYLLVKIDNTFITKTQAYEKGVKNFREQVKWLESGSIGNADFQRAFKYLKVSGRLYEEFKNTYLEIYSPYLAKRYKHENTELFDSYAL
jgi:hypothetical protein